MHVRKYRFVYKIVKHLCKGMSDCETVNESTHLRNVNDKKPSLMLLTKT